jgi:hypothetical protein
MWTATQTRREATSRTSTARSWTNSWSRRSKHAHDLHSAFAAGTPWSRSHRRLDRRQSGTSPGIFAKAHAEVPSHKNRLTGCVALA